MAQIMVRDVKDETIQRLKERAERYGRTFAEEIELILSRAAGTRAALPSKKLRVTIVNK
jgi:plasmid stability protein